MENLVTQLKSAYSGKRVLVTGDNGFKGSWLVSLLNELGAHVYGVSLEISENSPFKKFHALDTHETNILDIRDFESLSFAVNRIKPDLVFHLAAQALVSKSYENPRETFEINVQGTANLIDAVLQSSCQGIVVATTDKVYRNDDSGSIFEESDQLWGYDPYSFSKTGTELVVSAWRNLPEANRCKMVTVRAGNVFGPGDRASNRLLPDLLTGLWNDSEVLIRNPHSIRPWQYVLDPLIGYLLVGFKILTGQNISYSYNFGPSERSFITVNEFVEKMNLLVPIKILVQDDSTFVESKILKLNSTLARAELEWSSLTDISQGIAQTLRLEARDIEPLDMSNHVREFLSEFQDSHMQRFHNA